MIFLGEAEYKPKRKLRFTPFGGTAMGNLRFLQSYSRFSFLTILS